MRRRDALSTVAGSAAALTGCLSTVGIGSQPAGVVITRLSIENYTQATHEVSLEVVSNNDTVLSKTYDIDPRKGNVLGGQVIDANLPAEPSEVVIRAEMGNQRAEADLAERYNKACSKVMILIERDGRLAIFSSNEGAECFGRNTKDTVR